jgi:hypothetical protein
MNFCNDNCVFCIQFEIVESEQSIRISYFNQALNINLSNWKDAWLLSEKYLEKLYTEPYRNKVVYTKRKWQADQL